MRALAIALAIVTCSQVARADDRAKAEKYFSAGEQAYRQQSFGAAAEQFELAYAALPLPEIAFSAAQAYRRQYFVEPKPEYVKRAVELYRAYLDKVKTGGRVADASDGLAEMQRELDRLLVGGAKIGEVRHDATRIAVSVAVQGDRPSTLTELSTMPATTHTGAKATLDGKPIELFAPVVCTPGPHTVEVTADGYVGAKETRQVVEGSTELVEVKLEPLPAHLAIATDAGATIAIDGHSIGIAPIGDQDVPAGAHVVAVTRRGRVPIERSIAVTRGEHRTIALPMTMTGRRRAVPWLGLATGALAVGAIATTVLAIHYDDQMSSLDAERRSTGITTAQLADYHTDVRDRDGFRDAAFAIGGATVLAGVAAAALYYFDVPALGEHAISELPRRGGEPMIVPTATSSGAGVSVIGRF